MGLIIQTMEKYGKLWYNSFMSSRKTEGAISFDAIVNNVSATMAMEDMPLTSDDKQRIYDCLNDKISFDQAVQNLVQFYKRESA